MRADASRNGTRRQEFTLAQCLLAETFGTFALTFAAVGVEATSLLSHGEVASAARLAVPGLVVMAMIYAVGNVSGAHINPGVTLAFALRGVFPWVRVPGYWAAQVAGACAASLLLRGIFGKANTRAGLTLPKHGTTQALAMEIALAVLLYVVVLSTAKRHTLLGPHAGLAVGGTVAFAGILGGPISGASMNPARSIGPALVTGATASWWIYVAAPAAAALIAAGLTLTLQGPGEGSEIPAAAGGESQ